MNHIVAFALKQRVLMVLLLGFLSAAGIVSFAKLNIEAYPDPVPPLVDIVTQNPGLSAEEIERYITIPSLGQPTVQIDIDRLRAARYGLSPGDITATIAAAIGGQAAGNLYEEGSDRNFPMVVRLAPRYRESLSAIRRITISA